jgi:hypothetical protein
MVQPRVNQGRRDGLLCGAWQALRGLKISINQHFTHPRAACSSPPPGVGPTVVLAQMMGSIDALELPISVTPENQICRTLCWNRHRRWNPPAALGPLFPRGAAPPLLHF